MVKASTSHRDSLAGLQHGKHLLAIQNIPSHSPPVPKIKRELALTIKNLGPFTAKVKDLKKGEKVYFDGPYGAFSIDDYPDTKNLVLIPGGIGVTPIMSIMRTMADRGDQRPIKLFYANQTWDTVTFREEVESLQKKLNMEVIYVIEKPDEGWQGESGFLNHRYIEEIYPSRMVIIRNASVSVWANAHDGCG